MLGRGYSLTLCTAVGVNPDANAVVGLTERKISIRGYKTILQSSNVAVFYTHMPFRNSIQHNVLYSTMPYADYRDNMVVTTLAE